MPLVNTFISNDVNLYIWKINESVGELLSLSDATTIASMPAIKAESKKQEWLIERILLRQLLGDDVQLEHESNGQPILKGSQKYISISHTKGYLAIGISQFSSFGIDIEQYSERVNNITKHFLTETEECPYEDNATWHNLIIWSAKESIFKAMRNGVVNVMKNSIVVPFITQQHGHLDATTHEENNQYKSIIEYWRTEEYVFTVAKSLL